MLEVTAMDDRRDEPEPGDAVLARGGDLASRSGSEGKVACLHRGNTFFGTYAVRELEGASALVAVHYNGTSTAAEAEDFPVEDVAEALLRQLVVRERAAHDRANARPDAISIEDEQPLP